jgi:hypothetical protein
MDAPAWLDTPLLRWGLPVALTATLALLRRWSWSLKVVAAPLLYLALLRLLAVQDWPGALMLLAAVFNVWLNREEPLVDLFAHALLISLSTWHSPESTLLVSAGVLLLRLNFASLTTDAERWIGLGLLALHPTLPALICLVGGDLLLRSLSLAANRESRPWAAPGLTLGWLVFQTLRWL